MPRKIPASHSPDHEPREPRAARARAGTEPSTAAPAAPKAGKPASAVARRAAATPSEGADAAKPATGRAPDLAGASAGSAGKDTRSGRGAVSRAKPIAGRAAARAGEAAKAAPPLSPRRRKPVVEAAPAAPSPAPPAARRNRAVANAAAAAHGRTLTAWSAAEIVEAFSRFAAQDPEPKGELDHTDPYTLLVAVVLSAQATDAGVNKATKGLFAAAATPAAMVALGEEAVARHIRTLGLYKGKAKNVVELSRLLLERHHGAVPGDRDALEALPGVGRKTANVVMNIAFGAPTIAVDTHIFRVANRTGLAPGATPLAVEEGLEARIPDRFKPHAHHWLILHGRYICKARLPACGRCIIVDLCQWSDKHF